MESDLDRTLDQAEEGYLIPCRKADGTIDLLARASNGDTLLHVAVGQRDFTAIRRLIEVGLDINAQGDFHETPLYSAASRGDLGLVGFLLQLGADPGIPDHLGTLPSDVLLNRMKRLPEDCLLRLSEWIGANVQSEPTMNPAEQAGAGQPATAPESKPEGKEKPIPESEARPR
jgi:ankyrin repeat protein